MKMGARLKEELDERGMKPVELCAIVPDLDIGTLSAIYKRDSGNSKFAPAIARALDLELHWLLTGELPKFRALEHSALEAPLYAPDQTVSQKTELDLLFEKLQGLKDQDPLEADHIVAELKYMLGKASRNGIDTRYHQEPERSAVNAKK